MVIFVLASATLFDLTGTWSFSKAMSGTPWLTASLFALVAVYLRSRDWLWIAVGAAVLAAMSYGTGLVVWPALIATGACRRPIRKVWREWPYAVGLVATLLWYRESRMSGSEGLSSFSDPSGLFRAAATTVGVVFGLHGDSGRLIGEAVLI